MLLSDDQNICDSKLTLYGSFLSIIFSCLSAAKPLQEESLLFKSLRIHCAHPMASKERKVE